MKLLKFIFCVIFCSLSFSQTIEIECDSIVEQGMPFDIILNFESNNPQDEPYQILPPKDLEIIGQSGFQKTDQRGVIVNYELRVILNSFGDTYIKPFTFLTNNGKYVSEKKKINIKKRKSKPIYYEVFTDEIDNEVFIGEPIKITYKIFYPENYSPIIRDISDLPNHVDYQNASKKVIELKNLETNSVIRNGEKYNSIIVKSLILTYQKEGLYDIGKLESHKFNYYSNRVFLNSELKITNKLQIKVNPLPKERPMSFTGAVGQYNLKLEIEPPDSISFNDPSLSIKLMLSGYGNLNNFNLIELDLKNDPTIDVYGPELNEYSKMHNSRTIYGSKEYIYKVEANQKNPGFINFPVYEFTYFDPKKEEYITLSESSKKIKIIGDFKQNNNEDSGEVNSDYNEEKNSSSSKELRLLIIILLILIFSLILFFLLYYFNVIKRFKKKTQTRTAKTAKKQIKKAYELAKKDNPEIFKDLLLQSLSLYFSQKFNIKQSDFTKEKLANILAKNKISNDIINNSLNILHKLELFNYSGRVDLKISEGIFKDSIDIIDLIEKNKK